MRIAGVLLMAAGGLLLVWLYGPAMQATASPKGSAPATPGGSGESGRNGSAGSGAGGGGRGAW